MFWQRVYDIFVNISLLDTLENMDSSLSFPQIFGGNLEVINDMDAQ